MLRASVRVSGPAEEILVDFGIAPRTYFSRLSELLTDSSYPMDLDSTRTGALLEVSTSGFYNWRSRPQSATSIRRDVLAEQIRAFFDTSHGTYGYRRIHADLTEALAPNVPQNWFGRSCANMT